MIAIERRSGATHDFDAFDIDGAELRPVNLAVVLDIHRNAVDQYQRPAVARQAARIGLGDAVWR